MWIALEFTLSDNAVPQAEALLALAGAAAITVTDAGDAPLFEPWPGATPLWPEVRVEALFAAPIEPAHVAAALGAALGTPIAMTQRGVEDRDWQNVWREHWRPVRFGCRLTVTAADTAPVADTDTVVYLTPGLAFGTGQHPTTALCLEWLVEQNLAGRTVIDYGAGSGLLAIAALKLGAQHAYAVDIDHQALLACEQNARTNDVLRSITIGSPEVLARVEADILIANILAEPLKALAGRLDEHLSASGWLVLSGILEAQAGAVLAAYQGRFRFAAPVGRQGWVRLVAQLI